MEEPEPTSKPVAISGRLLLAVLAAAILLNPILLFRVPKLPEMSAMATIAAKTGFSDLSNYASHAVYFVGIFLVAAILFRFNMSAPTLRRLIVGMLFAMLIWRLPFTAPNPTFQSLVSPIVDEFHEGEFLGLAPNADTGQALPMPLLVHGPGMDYFPAWIGSMIAPAGYRIPTIRMFYRLLGSGAVTAFVLVLVILLKEREVSSSVLRYWVIGCALALTTALSIIGPRRFVFWLQVFILLLAARALRIENSYRYRVLIFALLGGALPLAVYYNYGFGISGALATVAGLALLIWRYGKRCAVLCLASIASAALMLLILYLACGASGLSAVVRDIQYWAHNGRDVAFWPVTPVSGAAVQSIIVMSVFALLLLSVARRLRRLRSNFDELYVLSILVIVAVCELRTYLDRADPQHLFLLTPTFLLIAVYILLPLAIPRATAACESITPSLHESLKWAAVAVFGVLIISGLNPLAALYANDELPREALSLPPDERVIAPELRLAVQELGPEIETQPCFFALSYSAVWYTAFNRPSCSAFYEPLYARSIAAQAQIVDELRRYRPKIVLAEDRGYLKIDGFRPKEICPQVWAYLQEAYVPLKKIGECQFYRLR